MSLTPNKWRKQTFDDFAVPDGFCEAFGSVTMHQAVHIDWSTRKEVVIDSDRTIRNQAGTIIRRDIEHYEVDSVGAPPIKYTRETWGTVYLPGLGRQYRKLEWEEATYHPWTFFQPGANLSCFRQRGGFCVFTTHNETMDQEAKDKLAERGQSADGEDGLVVDSGVPWEQAVGGGNVRESAGANQATRERDPFESQLTIVYREIDKDTSITYTKDHLRPGPPRMSEPTHHRRDSHEYSLGLPIMAPSITATVAGDEGVRVDVEGGGATWETPIWNENRGGVNSVSIPPDRYRIYRKATVDPQRPASGDPFGVWETDPAATAPSTFTSISNTTDTDGSPASPTPAEGSHDEPGDTGDENPMDRDDWREVATLENTRSRDEPGFATVLDDDVVSGAEYEYRATAEINNESSPHSAPASVAYGGATTSSGIRVRKRRLDDGTFEADAIAPSDPNLPPDDYGEVVDFEVPAYLPDEESETQLVDDITRRQFARNRSAKLKVNAKLALAVLGLVRGMPVKLPIIAWDTTGNGLVISNEIDPDPWLLNGWKQGARATKDSGLELHTTRLMLVER
ncbi:MAG: hypothetical protein GY906_11670 [bacterium]|nr:hypothetical protein [bacterium]